MNASGNTKKIHGLESMFGVNGCVSNSVAGDPNDSYANLTTNLGTYGGDWTADASNGWPTGVGDVEYHFWSPIVVDYQNSAFTPTESGGASSWKNQWQEALNYLITYGEVLQKNKFDLILITPEMMRTCKDSLISKQTFEVTQSSDALKLGFKTVQYGGTELMDEYGVPSACGYGLRFDKMELQSMQSQLFKLEKDTDITTSTEELALDFWGNMRFECPAYFGKLAAISELGT